MADQHEENEHPIVPVERRAEDRRLRVGSFVGGSAIGAAVAGPASAWLARREAFETMEWLQKNGFQGFLLFACFLLLTFALWCLREVRRIEDARRADEIARRVEAQALLREQTVLLPNLTVALVESGVQSRRVARALEHLRSIIVLEETPPDGTPTGSKP